MRRTHQIGRGARRTWTRFTTSTMENLTIQLIFFILFSVVAAQNTASAFTGSPTIHRIVAASITVHGQATQFSEPNVAFVGVGCHAFAKTAGEARNTAAAAMNSLFHSLQSSGVNITSDVVTTSFSIYPVFQQSMTPSPVEPIVIGFRVNNDLRVVVRNITNIAAVVDSSVAASGDHIQVSGVTFGLLDESQLKDQARVAAVEQAKHRAVVLSKAAGMALGNLIEMTEDEQGAMPMPKFAMPASDAESSTPIAQGQIDVSASVKMVYQLV